MPDFDAALQADEINPDNSNTGIVYGVGHRLKTIARDAKLSQAAFAKRLGIAERSVKNYMTEIRGLPFWLAIKVCDEFDVQLEWLARGTKVGLDKSGELAWRIYEVLMEEEASSGSKLEPARVAKIGRFVSGSLTVDSDVHKEVRRVLQLLAD